MIGEEVGSRWRALEPEDFEDQMLHAQNLLLRVGVVSDITKFGNIRRIYLFIFPDR